MKSKRVFIFLLILSITNINAQTIQKMILNLSGDIEMHTENYIFILNKNGSGMSFIPHNFNGDIDYYDNDFQEYNYGKYKKIGNHEVEYWNTSNVKDARFGKVKRIDNVEIDYWDSFNYDNAKFGKIKKIGLIQIDYYEKYGFNTEIEGNIKSINDFFIEYWDNVHDKAKFAKIKTFGSVKLDYWDDYYGDKFRYGKLKSMVGNSDKIQVRAQFGFIGNNYRYQSTFN